MSMTTLKERLNELEALRADGTLSEAEYQQARAAALTTPSVAAVTGIVATQPAQPPRPTCSKDHIMVFGERMVLHSSNGSSELEDVACDGCFFRLPKDEQYFHCKMCHLIYCETCVATGNVKRPVSHWHSGLFDCAKDRGSCADAFFCLPCFQTHMICFKGLEDGKPPERCGRDLLYTIPMCMFDAAFLGLSSACDLGYQRSKLTQVFNIQPREERCGACLLHCFCRCCSTAQIYREMKARGIDIGGFCCTAKAGVSQRPPKVSALGAPAHAASNFQREPLASLGYSSNDVAVHSPTFEGGNGPDQSAFCP